MVMRIGGLASGMDIDDIVSKMMMTHRAPINRLFQKRQQMEWQRDDLRSINSQLLDFRNNKLQPMIFNATYNAQKANVTGNSSVVTARIVDGATNGTTLNVSVEQLATASTAISGVIDIDALADLDEAVVFSINGADIKVEPGQTMNDIIRSINNNKEAGVTAVYDSGLNQMSLVAKKMGAGGITLVDSDNGFLSDTLKLTEVVSGENAKVTVNGLAIVNESNSLTINGIELNLTGVGDAATITVVADTDAVVDSIKTFIEDYNTILSALQDKLAETKYRDFLPLSDQQRKEMKDNGDDIEAWDEKAMSGLLRNDPLLTRAVADMRNIINSIIDTGSGDIESLASIGIGGIHYSEKGKLHILDEDKLRNAIENNPDAVAKLFNKREGSQPVGIAEKLYSTTKTLMDEVTARAGTAGNVSNTDLLGEQIARLNRQIEDGNQRMLKIENNLYRQFTAMETAIARYASQSAYLMNAFGGGAPQ